MYVCIKELVQFSSIIVYLYLFVYKKKIKSSLKFKSTPPINNGVKKISRTLKKI